MSSRKRNFCQEAFKLLHRLFIGGIIGIALAAASIQEVRPIEKPEDVNLKKIRSSGQMTTAFLAAVCASPTTTSHGDIPGIG